MSGDEVVSTEEVPQAWMERRNKVESITENLKSNLLTDPGVQYISITRDENKEIDDKNGLLPKIRTYNDKNTDLPKKAGSIPVKKGGEKKFEQTGCSQTDVDDGDCRVNKEDIKDSFGGGERVCSSSGCGTLTCEIYDQVTDDWQLLTCCHLFEDYCTSNLVGDGLWYNGNKIGGSSTL